MPSETEYISKWMADMYDAEETKTADAAFMLSLIGSVPQRILEIACGSGRLLVPLAEAGHTVHGLDIDECMLSKIPSKAKGLQHLTWQKADVTNEDWGNDFDVVVLGANFLFNITTDIDYAAAQELVICRSFAALSHGGHVFIDYGYTAQSEQWFACPSARTIFKGTDSAGNTGYMQLLDSRYDKTTGLCSFTRRFDLTLQNGASIRRDIPCVKHFPALDEVHLWLSRAGFIIKGQFGDYLANPISSQTSRAILWAEKP